MLCVSDPTLKGLGLGQRETPKPGLTRRLTEMVVAVTEECIGTDGCSSKSAALRVHIKQSCEVGTVCAPTKGNPLQRSDGHLTPTPKGEGNAAVMRPGAGDLPSRRTNFLTTTTERERRVRNSSQT